VTICPVLHFEVVVVVAVAVAVAVAAAGVEDLDHQKAAAGR